MSIKNEVLALILADLSQSTEQQWMNTLYDELKFSIQNPSVQTMFIKKFDEEKTEEQLNIIKMICKKDLGFIPYVDSRSIMIIMIDFLE